MHEFCVCHHKLLIVHGRPKCMFSLYRLEEITKDVTNDKRFIAFELFTAIDDRFNKVIIFSTGHFSPQATIWIPFTKCWHQLEPKMKLQIAKLELVNTF